MSVVDEEWRVNIEPVVVPEGESAAQLARLMGSRPRTGSDVLAWFGDGDVNQFGLVVATPVDTLRCELAAMAPEMGRELLALEWSGESVGGRFCPTCQAIPSWAGDAHEPGCKLGALCGRLRKLAATSG